MDEVGNAATLSGDFFPITDPVFVCARAADTGQKNESPNTLTDPYAFAPSQVQRATF